MYTKSAEFQDMIRVIAERDGISIDELSKGFELFTSLVSKAVSDSLLIKIHQVPFSSFGDS